MKLKTVRLYGDLGKEFGTVHHFAVKTPAEAIRALCANKKGFKKVMLQSHHHGIGYVVKNGNHALDKVEDALQPASGEIQIIPMLIGANAEFRILIGAALIAVGVAINIASEGAGTPIGNAFIGTGIALALGGVVQMLSPPPPTIDIPERPENKPSYNFSGPVNTVAQGHPVAIGYGRMIVGSNVISASITLEQLQQGFKRVKITVSVNVKIVRNTGEVYSSSPNPIPANFYTRSFVSTEPVIFVGPVDLYTYYYYRWELQAV